MGVAAVLVFALPVSSGAARSNAACELPGYSYAGYVSSAPVHAVGATITAEQTPRVAGGHVAAWVGIGSLHAGPHRSNEWLQAGLVSYGASTFRLYVEPVGGDSGAVRIGEFTIFDPDHSAFFHPLDMPAAIADFCRTTRQTAPATPAAFTRAVLESLAFKYRAVIESLFACH